ncbi:MAG: RDD family protein [Bacteroidota bacterium]
MKLRETAKRKRLANFIIDLIVIGTLLEITFILESNMDYKVPMKVLRVIIALGGYYIPLEFFLGKTVGKYVTRSRVVDWRGQRISLRAAVLRYACRWIPFEFASLALGNDAKAWHDTLLETYVVDEFDPLYMDTAQDVLDDGQI